MVLSHLNSLESLDTLIMAVEHIGPECFIFKYSVEAEISHSTNLSLRTIQSLTFVMLTLGKLCYYAFYCCNQVFH